MEVSLTQTMAVFIIIGSMLYFVLNLPSILPILNIVLGIVYALFVFNIIKFTAQRDLLLSGTLIVILGLSIFQIITCSRKFAVVGAVIEAMGAATALLVYTKVITKIIYLKKLIR